VKRRPAEGCSPSWFADEPRHPIPTHPLGARSDLCLIAGSQNEAGVRVAGPRCLSPVPLAWFPCATISSRLQAPFRNTGQVESGCERGVSGGSANEPNLFLVTAVSSTQPIWVYGVASVAKPVEGHGGQLRSASRPSPAARGGASKTHRTRGGGGRGVRSGPCPPRRQPIPMSGKRSPEPAGDPR